MAGVIKTIVDDSGHRSARFRRQGWRTAYYRERIGNGILSGSPCKNARTANRRLD
jgi:hypothetical protein